MTATAHEPGGAGAATSTDTSHAVTPASQLSTARLWRMVALALGGLLVGVAVACLAAMVLTINVGQVTNQALRNDIELEDEADDFRVAVLDVRHYHRNLVFTGPTRIALDDFDRAVAGLFEEIGELGLVEIRSPEVKQAHELRAMVEVYLDAYRPAVQLYESDRAAFDAASDEGLTRLAELGSEAERLDTLGEELAELALLEVERSTSTATVILLAVLLGVGLAALALALAAVRVLRELRGLDQAQRDANSALSAALRSRTDFIADASHELRTPLTVLRGNAEVALAMKHEDAITPLLRDIVSESERMTRLVEDLLFLARSDAGSAPLELRDVELEPWLAEVAARAEVLCRQRGVAFVPRLEASGPARLDAERMEQAVMILVDNAAKFSPAGAAVTLEARDVGSDLVIAVVDQGPGIAADVLPHVFDRFRRGDRARGRRQSGAGLGLSIAQAIVVAHGGRIEPASEPGRGTRMAICLPRSGPPLTIAADPAAVPSP